MVLWPRPYCTHYQNTFFYSRFINKSQRPNRNKVMEWPCYKADQINRKEKQNETHRRGFSHCPWSAWPENGLWWHPRGRSQSCTPRSSHWCDASRKHLSGGVSIGILVTCIVHAIAMSPGNNSIGGSPVISSVWSPTCLIQILEPAYLIQIRKPVYLIRKQLYGICKILNRKRDSNFIRL